MVNAAPKRTLPRRPREHGAWAILGVSLLTGTLIGGPQGKVSTLLLLFTALAALLARAAVRPLVRPGRNPRPPRFQAQVRWALGWLGLTTLGGGLLIGAGKHFWLLYLGLGAGLLAGLDLWLIHQQAERTVSGELVGVAALTLTAPAAYGMAAGGLDGTAGALWLLCWAYFAVPVFYVKMFSAWRSGRDIPYWEKMAWRVHSGTLLILASLALGGWIPWMAVLPFGLALGKVLYSRRWEREREVSFKTLGWRETGLALSFALCLWLGYGSAR